MKEIKNNKNIKKEENKRENNIWKNEETQGNKGKNKGTNKGKTNGKAKGTLWETLEKHWKRGNLENFGKLTVFNGFQRVSTGSNTGSTGSNTGSQYFYYLISQYPAYPNGVYTVTPEIMHFLGQEMGINQFLGKKCISWDTKYISWGKKWE